MQLPLCPRKENWEGVRDSEGGKTEGVKFQRIPCSTRARAAERRKGEGGRIIGRGVWEGGKRA